MTDDQNLRGLPDGMRIDVREPQELRYWTQALGISEDHLRQLVERFGASIDAVRNAVGR